MRRYVVLIGLLLLVALQGPDTWAATLDEPGKLPPGRTEMPDKSQEDDCDCCQKCKAAQKPISGDEESDTGQKTGCEQCCERCGRVLPSNPEQSPPDIIEKPQR